MPIVHMTFDPASVPADARNLKLLDEKEGGPKGCYTYETHHGLCLLERERNMYDDSDFYMLVWDVEKQAPEEIMFASTRGWTYPCYASHRDATPEVWAAYQTYLQEQEQRREAARRAAQARELNTLRNRLQNIAHEHALPYNRLLVLRRELPSQDFSALLGLFSNRIKSGFKLSLRGQVVNWCQQPDPKYPTPLSNKQMRYL